MKLKNLFTAGLSIAVGFTAVKYLTFSNQQNQVKELLQTKQCPECNFSNANLKGLDLQGVNLQGANLEGANLSEAKLANANLKNANLNKANLTGSDLGCAGITFNFDANEEGANMDFKVSAVPEKNNPENAVVGFNMKATDRGATMRFNLMGCADFSNASLQGAQMPNGTIHP
ncbi:pentapeptide repeat-containing protein [Microcoleus sp. F10-C6]|uniref:pentapeptide repeat-containing protein n=1 Tax=unclassified Microcoleus TaxID=2642155 RepID=UPI002FD3F3EF